MAHTDTTVNTLKINRGTYANIQSNLSSIGENELIITTDKGTPVPTTSDSGKVISVNSSGEYELTTPSAGTTYSAGTGISIASNTISNTGVAYLTTAPSSANTSGDLKFVVLDSEPQTKYDGYFYIITEPAGYEVTITFSNSTPSNNSGYWWEVYSDYAITNNILQLLSTNQLGTRQTGTQGSITVTTTTGKLFIVCRGDQSDYADSCGTITPSTGITTTGYRSGYSTISGDCAQISSGMYLDGEPYQENSNNLEYLGCLFYSFTVTADGTISISSSIWND